MRLQSGPTHATYRPTLFRRRDGCDAFVTLTGDCGRDGCDAFVTLAGEGRGPLGDRNHERRDAGQVARSAAAAHRPDCR
eukprot:4625425-Pyramimonas_sp.AAC.2